MSVTDPAVELTICATDRELYVITLASRALRSGGRELSVSSDTDRQDSTGVASTGTSDDSQMCMHCQPAIGAVGHHQTSSIDMHRLALLAYCGQHEF